MKSGKRPVSSSFDYALFAVHRDVQFSPIRSNIQAGTAQGTAPTMTL